MFTVDTDGFTQALWLWLPIRNAPRAKQMFLGGRALDGIGQLQPGHAVRHRDHWLICTPSPISDSSLWVALRQQIKSECSPLKLLGKASKFIIHRTGADGDAWVPTTGPCSNTILEAQITRNKQGALKRRHG